MTFQLILTDNDVKEAVAVWLKSKGWNVEPADLEPVTKEEHEGEYEDHRTTITQVGYQVKPEAIERILQGKKHAK